MQGRNQIEKTTGTIAPPGHDPRHESIGPSLRLVIGDGYSPEMAIKAAYDFARSVRAAGFDEHDFPDALLFFVSDPYRDSPLRVYINGGFCAGYFYDSLPWRRQIESQSPDPASVPVEQRARRDTVSGVPQRGADIHGGAC